MITQSYTPVVKKKKKKDVSKKTFLFNQNKQGNKQDSMTSIFRLGIFPLMKYLRKGDVCKWHPNIEKEVIEQS